MFAFVCPGGYASMTSTIQSRLRGVVTPIGGNDLWIACHALALDAELVTSNRREFLHLDGLRLENWVG
jgi:tRNA(fMet)-specific endonuclease VapC